MELKTAYSFLELQKTQNITTDIMEIDQYLGGGIELGRITELVGPPGAGKTQLCLKLCLNVQIPIAMGGLQGRAIYIDTRKDFDPARLQELAMGLEKRFQPQQTKFNAKNMLKNVYYIDCPSAARLMASILSLRKYLTTIPNIKLIVVDSLSFAIRMLENISERTALLMELHDCVRRLICTYDVAFVITNELSFRRHKHRWQLEQTLGQKHTHLINERIWLTGYAYYIGKSLNTRRLVARVAELN